MASLSKIFIIGNVGRDPELRMTPNGKPVTEFSVAVNRVTNSQGGERNEQTDWYRVTCWGKQADIAQQYVTKGTPIFVEGRFQPREWQDKEGQKRISLEITADNFQMLGSRRDREGGMGGGEVAGENTKGSFDPDEIPF